MSVQRKPSKSFIRAFERLVNDPEAMARAAEAGASFESLPTMAHPETGFNLVCPHHGPYAKYRVMTDGTWRPLEVATGNAYPDDHGRIAPKCRCGFGARYRASRVDDLMRQLALYAAEHGSVPVIAVSDLSRLTK